MAIHGAIGLFLLQTVWVVDDSGGPGVDFTDIQPAIGTAQDGDVILVHAGYYNHFTVDGKGLRILGDGSSGTFVRTPPFNPSTVTRIQNVPAGSPACVAGLTIGSPLGGFFDPPYQRIEISGSTTRAVLSDVILVPGASPSGSGGLGPPGPGLLVDGAEVHLFGCDLTGLQGSFGQNSVPGPDGTAGLAAKSGARVHVVSSTIVGGSGPFAAGGPSFCIGTPPGNGGPGLVASSSGGLLTWVWIADSTIHGGSGGGFASPIGAFCSSYGGPGIRALSSRVRASGDATATIHGGFGLGLSLLGGAAIESVGAAFVDVHSVPVLPGPGAPATVGSGITLDLPPLPVLSWTGNPTIGTGSIALSLSNGIPDALFLVVLAGAPDYFGIPGPFLGEFVIALPFPPPFVGGALSPAGEFSLTVPLANLPPSLAYVPFHLQGVLLDLGGT